MNKWNQNLAIALTGLVVYRLFGYFYYFGMKIFFIEIVKWKYKISSFILIWITGYINKQKTHVQSRAWFEMIYMKRDEHRSTLKIYLIPKIMECSTLLFQERTNNLWVTPKIYYFLYYTHYGILLGVIELFLGVPSTL